MRIQKTLHVSFITAVVSILFLFSSTALAAAPKDSLGNPSDGQNNPHSSGGPVSLQNPLGTSEEARSPQALIGRVINFAMGLVGSLALLMFVYGGFLWMTSSGNEEKVDQGKRILIWATAGLALIFFSYALVYFIIYQGILGQAGP